MAEESMKILFTPEISKPDKGNPRRNSTGILRKDSTGQSSSPNYLRASTGSCHDFCKYGREHSFAVKARNPVSKKLNPRSGKQKNIGSEVLAERKKTSAVKLKPSTDLRIHSPVVPAVRKETLSVKLKTSPDLIHSPEPPEIIKREILLSKQNPSNTKIMKDKGMKKTSSSNRFPAPKSKPVMVRKSYSSTASVESNGSRKTIIKPGKITGTSKTAVKKLPAPPTASFSPKLSGSSVMSLYASKYSSLKPASPIKYQYRTWKAESKKSDNDKLRKAESKKLDDDKVQEKILHVVGVESENKILECVQGDGIIQVSPSLSPFLQSPKLLSPPDSQFLSSNGDDVKSEYGDREDLEQYECTGREDLEDSEFTDREDLEESDREDLEESEYTEGGSDEFISENDQVVNIDDVDTLKGNHNQSPRKGRVIPFEDKDNALAKSKFRRGKIVDLQSENNVPRRLRFRKGRVVDSNDNKSYARRRSFKKREVGDEKTGARPSSEKVVLRHQDMQGKKDAQGLFNNVIEETASKLVESRKSKVKALVGAFETVISLQEIKPSTQTGT